MGAFLFFIGQFVRHPGRVAAIAPSSQRLASAMLEGIALAPGDAIVEYGPGTGSFTRAIQPLLKEGVRYVGIERNDSFVTYLREQFPALEFVAGSAADVETILAERGIRRPRAVISGLPLASMPRALRVAIVEATSRALAGGGEFRQFSYVHFYPFPGGRDLRALMRGAFTEFTVSRPVLRNVPPAFVYGGRN